MAEEKDKPITREDVLRLIKENSGKSEGLDLSDKEFIDGIDLSGLDLKGIILKNVQCFPIFWTLTMLSVLLEENVLSDVDREEVRSSGAHLEKARLSYAHLEGAYLPFSHFEHCDLSRARLEGAFLPFAFLWGASLVDAHLEGTRLTGAHLEGTTLGLAHLEGAFLGGANFSDDTKLEGADWGNYILGEEKNGAFRIASETYRRLKKWYTNAGMYDIAGKFFFREMTAKRKAMKWWPNLLNRAFSKLISVLCGYGEKPERVVVSAIVIIFGLAIAYHLGGSFDTSSFWDKLYYSIVSFTALGYGNWAPQPTGWAKGIGAAEAFLGVFMMALFLITFTRKMTR